MIGSVFLSAIVIFTSYYIDEDLTDRYHLPRASTKVIDILTDGEVQRLLASFDTATTNGLRDYTICALMVDSGLRLNEIVSLQSKNVHLEE